jgi:hypothetical protein
MTVTEAAVLDALRAVKDPDLHKDIVSLGFVKNLDIKGARGVHHRADDAGVSRQGAAAGSSQERGLGDSWRGICGDRDDGAGSRSRPA